MAGTGQTKEAPYSHWNMTMSEKRNCRGVETTRDKEFRHSTEKNEDGIVESSELLSGDKKDYSLKLTLPW